MANVGSIVLLQLCCVLIDREQKGGEVRHRENNLSFVVNRILITKNLKMEENYNGKVKTVSLSKNKELLY